MSISKEQFKSYEKVRRSGATNMFNIGMVSALSGLDRTEVREIMENYSKLEKQYKK
jgi:Pyruvate/2-oxoacid:ferredoxin oxidoreductase gamma subunit